MRKMSSALLCALPLTLLATIIANAATQDARPPDRLGFSLNGSTLTDTDGGGGGSINWLHYFTPNAMLGVGAEHQFIADSQWTFGSLRGSWAHGQPASRFTLYGEVHQGSGDDDGRDFDYAIQVLGLSKGFTREFSVQFEGRHIDIDQSYGNLPKLGVSYLFTPRLLATVAYANSYGGNLGTELGTGRIDYYGTHVNLILGGAWGQADPAVLNLEPGLSLPAQDLKEGFVGIGKTFTHGELLLMGDYLKLEDSDKVTVTLSYVAYLGVRNRTR